MLEIGSRDVDHVAWMTPVCPVVRKLAAYFKVRDRYTELGASAEADACGEALVMMEWEIAGLKARSTAGLMMQVRIAQRVADQVDHETAQRLLLTFAGYAEGVAKGGRFIT